MCVINNLFTHRFRAHSPTLTPFSPCFHRQPISFPSINNQLSYRKPADSTCTIHGLSGQSSLHVTTAYINIQPYRTINYNVQLHLQPNLRLRAHNYLHYIKYGTKEFAEAALTDIHEQSGAPFACKSI